MGCEESVELPPNYVIVNKICSTKLYNTFKVKKADSSEVEIMKQYISIGRRLNDRKIFQKEIEAISNINHPYILKYNLITELNSCLVVVMPQIKMNLIDFSNTIKYTTKMKLMVLKDVVVAVAYLHKNGFEHGNLKPSNVLINEDLSKCYLTDYSQNIIYNSYRAGIPYYRDNYNYLSPETLLSKEISDKSDIWSLGMLVYFIVEGRDLLKCETDKRKALNSLNELFRGITVYESMGKFLKKVFIYEEKDRMDIDDLMRELMVNEFLKIPEGFEFKVTEEKEINDNINGNEKKEEIFNVNENQQQEEKEENKSENEDNYYEFDNVIEDENDNNNNHNNNKEEEEEKTDENNDNNNNDNESSDESNHADDDIEAIIENEKKKIQQMNNSSLFAMINGNKGAGGGGNTENMNMIEEYIKSLDPTKDCEIDVSNSIYIYVLLLLCNLENLCDEDITFLCSILSSLSFITGVNVSGNSFTNKGLSKICDVLENNKNIRSINISGNKTTLEFMFFFVSVGAFNLTEIIINNARLRDSDLTRFCNGFCDLPQLINLELAGNSISDYSFKTFSEEMVNFSQIEMLNFSRNSITDDGLLYFVDRMSCITTLKQFNINNNKITEKSIGKLIGQLSVCTKLKITL